MATKKRKTRRKAPITKTHEPIDAFPKASTARDAAKDYTAAMRAGSSTSCSAVVKRHSDGRRLKYTVYVPKACKRYL